ncbi:bifunctional glutamate N-acetyltransferase/amino-acid acetyltransferase ArgJ, partial [bacterium]|nr:bifunctional glutamate N-acetyltransferase/amino-acid acetyltransferase ArgJ [bacterium]
GKEKIKSGLCQAVLVNSGNANCFTGPKGIDDTRLCSKMISSALKIDEDLVFVSSTGVIGANLPMDRFVTGIPDIAGKISKNNIDDFADAILTTDTNKKIIKKSGVINDKKFSIMGIAKGSGMIRPDMATMLAYICTDVNISAENLQTTLKKANEKSFNRITIDGDTSTNDTLLALANGMSQIKIDNVQSKTIFQELLNQVCFELASMIVQDGEGATKLVQIVVKGASTKDDAYKACEAIAHSNLVKTAIYGEDPNWGRITAAAGRSGADVDPEKMDLFFDGKPLVLKGQWLGIDAEKKTAEIMKNSKIEITLDLNLGQETDFYLFCDFSEDYVKINAEYRS